ncbi:hypothetical protein TREES_T100003877 [Tupaia chinensis]|uniref:Uncharacterized protein n=1 Tax=Tupaia chinensis TaxID=246437 RepID=L9L067_TUPCH|nr:hypothetical protein TREES_T100003877 [Tupaia chinensis]
MWPQSARSSHYLTLHRECPVALAFPLASGRRPLLVHCCGMVGPLPGLSKGLQRGAGWRGSCTHSSNGRLLAGSASFAKAPGLGLELSLPWTLGLPSKKCWTGEAVSKKRTTANARTYRLAGEPVCRELEEVDHMCNPEPASPQPCRNQPQPGGQQGQARTRLSFDTGLLARQDAPEDTPEDTCRSSYSPFTRALGQGRREAHDSREAVRNAQDVLQICWNILSTTKKRPDRQDMLAEATEMALVKGQLSAQSTEEGDFGAPHGGPNGWTTVGEDAGGGAGAPRQSSERAQGPQWQRQSEKVTLQYSPTVTVSVNTLSQDTPDTIQYSPTVMVSVNTLSQDTPDTLQCRPTGTVSVNTLSQDPPDTIQYSPTVMVSVNTLSQDTPDTIQYRPTGTLLENELSEQLQVHMAMTWAVEAGSTPTHGGGSACAGQVSKPTHGALGVLWCPQIHYQGTL